MTDPSQNRFGKRWEWRKTDGLRKEKLCQWLAAKWAKKLGLEGARGVCLSYRMPTLVDSPEGWYCFAALPKKEHIAAQLLRAERGMDVLCPRVSYLKLTKRGKVKFTEPLFPGYLFIKTDLVNEYRIIQSTQGIRCLVTYGERAPLVPESFIEALRARLDAENVKALPQPVLKDGQTVKIAEGPFRNWEAVVRGEVGPRDRVTLLLDFLGRQMAVRVPVESVIVETDKPRNRVWES